MIDVIGLELDEARRRLGDAGRRVGAVIETHPPRPVPLAGPLRVVRIRSGVDDSVELVVTPERYQSRSAVVQDQSGVER